MSLDSGLGAVAGLQSIGISADFRRNPQRKDLALIVAPEGSLATAVFTQNKFCAAPVLISKNHIKAMNDKALASQPAGDFRALIINSGNANAATGQPGLEAATKTAQIVAQNIGCEPHQILVASTGVIGQQLGIENFATGVPQALALLNQENGDAITAAEAIMTTDTVPKTASTTFGGAQSDGVEVSYSIGGMAKGSGMIEPNMATMIAVLATDAMVTREAAEKALQAAVGQSFNKVTIDSDTSTNDSAFFIATGAIAKKTINATCPLYQAFEDALTTVCQDLAYQIAKDGEGATKVITVVVNNANTAADADAAARAIANSPLVKTAVAGRDANWGRVAMAVGKSSARFNQEDVDISIMGMEVCQSGLAVPFSEQQALQLFAENDEIVIEVSLGAGEHSTKIWTCDLTHNYITINGDYRT
jgi:glutamate N-acetyltransferase/amino-acid N-acetyltransferase